MDVAILSPRLFSTPCCKLNRKGSDSKHSYKANHSISSHNHLFHIPRVNQVAFKSVKFPKLKNLKVKSGPRFLAVSNNVQNSEGQLSSYQEVESSFLKKWESFLLTQQETICSQSSETDGSGKNFIFDKWQRGRNPEDGYGITRVLENGAIFEKAAVNVSIIKGKLSSARAKAISSRGNSVKEGSEYFAGALSLVFHPTNPRVPTFRADVRYFEVESIPGWFGGGADLTPCYLYESDAIEFHSFYKSICDKYDPSLYKCMKSLCDSYFYIPARKEHRGIGGIFFDDVSSLPTPSSSSSPTSSPTSDLQSQTQTQTSNAISVQGPSDEVRDEVQDRACAFAEDVARGFMDSYLPIARRRSVERYGEEERRWQLVRRGRYLEFNLLYDRGVRFGLDGGRVESIMVSAPPLIAWKYNFVPKEGSEEEKMQNLLSGPCKDWLV